MYWLSKARRALGRPGVRLVSFDVFDTLLLRNTKPEPARFLEIAGRQHRALVQAGIQAPPVMDLLFARLEAAHIAYRSAPLVQGEREASWEGILDLLVRALGLETGLEQKAFEIFTRVELAYEAENLRPNTALVTLLGQAGAGGKRLAFVSDMYLGAGRITELIGRLAPGFSWDAGYVSSEAGVTKRGGGLYRHLLREEKLEPSQVVHLGDDPKGDVAVARSLGINAVAAPRPVWWRLARRARLRRFYRDMARRGFPFPG